MAKLLNTNEDNRMIRGLMLIIRLIILLTINIYFLTKINYKMMLFAAHFRFIQTEDKEK